MFDINKIRQDFPILQETIYGSPLVYLDNAATTHKPKQVTGETTSFYFKQNSNVHRGSHHLSELASGIYEDTRSTVQQFINAKHASEVIFTKGTTDAINMLAYSFEQSFINNESEIIITEMEHHSNYVPWIMLAKRTGATLKILPIHDEGTLVLDKLDSLITQKTRLISVSYVSNVLGTINPIEKIIRTAHAHDIPVMIDAAQAIQHIPVDVQQLDCDFMAFSGHKMYAETGIGILYGKKKWLDAMHPPVYGGGMVKEVGLHHAEFLESPSKFEAGTSNVSGAVSLAAAIRYINETGLHHIASHEQEIYEYALQQLQASKDIIIYGNGDKCGAISFNLKNIHPYDVGAILDKKGIAVRAGHHCAKPLINRLGLNGTIRISFGVYNTKSEIDTLMKGIEKANKILN